LLQQTFIKWPSDLSSALLDNQGINQRQAKGDANMATEPTKHTIRVEGLQLEITDEEPPAATERTNWNEVIRKLREQHPDKWARVKERTSAAMATNLKKRPGVDARMTGTKDGKGTLWLKVSPPQS
jgi:hypothetical protein